MTNGPHAGTDVLRMGRAPEKASGAVVLLHGRGSNAEDMMGLAQELNLPGVVFMAPQASGHTWYPNSFMAPREENEPWVSSALAKVETVVQELESLGVAREKIAVLGFSQGACLASEFVASHPARYAGIVALTGGLIGAPGINLQHAGDLAGTPVLLSSGDPDPHVPWSRVEETARELERMGAVVKVDRYPGRPHTVSRLEVVAARTLLAQAFGLKEA